MASMIDAFREVFSDKLSFIKLGLYTALSYYAFLVSYDSTLKNPSMLWLIILTELILFGLTIKVANNVINERDNILPSFNPLEPLWSAIKGIIAIGPFGAVIFFIASYLTGMINIILWLDIILKIIIWVLAFALFITAFSVFTIRERILDVYKIKTLFDKSGDMIIVTIFFILKSAVVNIIIVGFLGYIFYILFGAGHVFNIFLTFATVFNAAATGHYWGQINYETFDDERK